jgi:hypothetical protein
MAPASPRLSDQLYALVLVAQSGVRTGADQAKAVTPPKMSAPPPPMARAAANGASQLRRSRTEPIEPKVPRMPSPFDLNGRNAPLASNGGIAPLAPYAPYAPYGSIARFVTPVTDRRCPRHATPTRWRVPPPAAPGRGEASPF